MDQRPILPTVSCIRFLKIFIIVVLGLALFDYRSTDVRFQG